MKFDLPKKKKDVKIKKESEKNLNSNKLKWKKINSKEKKKKLSYEILKKEFDKIKCSVLELSKKSFTSETKILINPNTKSCKNSKQLRENKLVKV